MNDENTKITEENLDAANKGAEILSAESAENTSVADAIPLDSVTSDKGELGQQKGTEVSIKTLLDSAAHFGHETDRWNPKMTPYIYGEKNGVHIINLDITLNRWREARSFLVKTLSEGGNVLFVGTKTQIRQIVLEEATRCGGHYMTTRWLGGTLTNFETIKKSIDKMRKLEDLIAESQKPDTQVRINKKERLTLSKQVDTYVANIGGIRSMKGQPALVIVLDVNKEHIAVAEAKKLNIPVLALVDTNVDPTKVDFPIPVNDDSSKTVRLMMSAIADAVIEGKTLYQSRMQRTGGISANGEANGMTERSNRGRRRNSGGKETSNRESNTKEGKEDVTARTPEVTVATT